MVPAMKVMVPAKAILNKNPVYKPLCNRPGVNPPSTILNPNPIPNPIPVNLAMIPNPIPVIFPSVNPTPILISSY